MKGIEIPYAIDLDRVDKILQALILHDGSGMSIDSIFNMIDYADATGKSMHIRFLEKNGLIEKIAKNHLILTDQGKNFLDFDESAKKEHYKQHLEDGLIEILKILAISEKNQLSVEKIFERLQQMHEIESQRTLSVKKQFAKKLLEYLGLVEHSEDPEPILKLTSDGREIIMNQSKSMQNSKQEASKKQEIKKIVEKPSNEPVTKTSSIQSDKIGQEETDVLIPSDTNVSEGIDEENHQEGKKSGFKKSVRYPYYSLAKIVEFTDLIGRMAGYGEVQVESAVQSMGLGSEKTKSFAYTRSAGEQFNLVDRGKKGLKLTDLGKKLVFGNPDDKLKRSLLQQAFFSVPFYVSLRDRYKSIKLPDDKILKTVFIDMGITEDAADNALVVFKESALLSGAIENNRFIDMAQTNTKESEKKTQEKVQPEPGVALQMQSQNQSIPTQQMNQTASEPYLNISLPTKTGMKIIIQIPKNTTPQEINLVKGLLDAYASQSEVNT